MHRTSYLPLQLLAAFALALFASAISAADDPETAPFIVEPASIELTGRLDRLQLQVSAFESARHVDLTRQVRYQIESASVLTVDGSGRLRPLNNGETALLVTQGEATVRVPVTVSGVDTSTPNFARDIVPILSKAGCNQGACHASQYGKGEFKLSLFGYAPEQDHPQFVRDWQQRRVSFVDPASSLIMKKATLQISHGGGQRFRVGSFEYDQMLDWLAAGASGTTKTDPIVVGMSISPEHRVYSEGDSQQLRVIATYNDGSTRDVTHLALYDSMGEGVATVDQHGLITAVGPGQAAIMVRFQGQAKVSMAMQPHRTDADLSHFVVQNFVDEAVKDHWQQLGVVPAGLCSDEVFIRRAFLDSIGTLPSREKVEEFLASDKANKREELVDELLGLTGDSTRDIYVSDWSAYWALKWGDLLRNNRNKVGDGGMWALYNWMRASFRENKPFDKFVREIVTAQGSIYANGPANYFKIATTPTDLAETTAQVFLGVRLQCAKCHHHPFEVYSQADYYGLAAFFTRVGTKGSSDFGALGRDTVVMLKSSGSISHPRTRKTMSPTPLQSEPVDLDGVRDFRRPLADWLTSKDNRLFSRNIVNRVWGYFMGTGLVEPIDDLRETNPASVPALLDALAEDFANNGFDQRRLMRNIMTSRVYQLDSSPLPENATDTRLYLHYNVKRLPAEVLLDGIDDAAGTQERFTGVPLGTRAIELPDSNFTSYFLDTTGRPQRVIACECERTSTPNLAAVLHLVNGDVIQRKLTDKNNRIAGFIKNKVPVEDAVRELYLVTFSRPPSDDEVTAAASHIATAESPQQGFEDILWALINSREFLFNH
ncbi:MAG: DUF1553 domain-containing protein [Rhodopirellula sp.]|nr:DUF1553 domain-containing protein [Rhodopirellula sp.]